MTAIAPLPPLAPSSRGSVPVAAFAISVLMWAAGYFTHLPAVLAGLRSLGDALGLADPGTLGVAITLGLFAIVQLAGGFAYARLAPASARWLPVIGLASAFINLLVLGAIVAEPGRRATALLWVTGSLLQSVAFVTAGGMLGARLARHRPPADVNWLAAMAATLALATFILVCLGGLVTGYEAGLAVPDWPNTEGQLMWLYPLSKMTGGIYLEHAHRLYGSLVGLTTLAFVVLTFRLDRRPWFRALAIVALVAVITQGIMGGLRVTGRVTLSQRIEDLRPSTPLAITHGIFGQLFFALTVVLASAASRRWSRFSADATPQARTDTDRFAPLVLLATVVLQLLLGAILRHKGVMLSIHITFAIVVTIAAIAVGVRLMKLHQGRPVLPRLGAIICSLIAAQWVLGFVAWLATGHTATTGQVNAFDAITTTLHQANGALILATTAAIAAWSMPQKAPGARPQAAGAEANAPLPVAPGA